MSLGQRHPQGVVGARHVDWLHGGVRGDHRLPAGCGSSKRHSTREGTSAGTSEPTMVAASRWSSRWSGMSTVSGAGSPQPRHNTLASSTPGHRKNRRWFGSRAIERCTRPSSHGQRNRKYVAPQVRVHLSRWSRRALARSLVDALPTWPIVCFFLREPYRGKGLFRHLVTLAIDYARKSGAPRIEAYPRERHRTGTWACMEVAEVYQSLGFSEIARRKEDRPVLRLELARKVARE